MISFDEIKERLPSLTLEKIVEWSVAALLAGVVALARARVDVIFRADPAAFLVCAAAVLALGYLIGRAVGDAKGDKEARLAKIQADAELEKQRMAYEREDELERRRREEVAEAERKKAAEAKRKREDSLAETYEHLCFRDKLFIRTLHRNGRTCASDPLIGNAAFRFVEYSTASWDSSEYRLNEEAAALFDSRPELLDFDRPGVAGPSRRAR